MKPPRARRPSGCPVPYDRGRFGAFLSSVARDTSPSPNSSPLPTPPHLLEVQQPAGGGQSASMRSGRQAKPRILAGKNWPLAFWVLQECVAAIRPEPARRRCRAAHAFGPENRPRPAPPALFSQRSHMRPKRAGFGWEGEGSDRGARAARKLRFRSVGAAIGRSTHCQHRTGGGGACGPRWEGRSWERRNRTREIPR